ncbi:hypothetical protein E6C76_20105 [Pseudothauera nasutitermitis]|uniref:Tape measure protein N-terminal domain-containing protein n=1 Tax=Pseudothauera nasutitermitis TaxID=2565930 RepID=A0A4S4AP01_9RHOO|nr:tape measure protein [Pseudothauera nasutitermitis]THF61389.1 hypothetical protein E6C76_20105 [Pseudothauera nasutitermitis]
MDTRNLANEQRRLAAQADNLRGRIANLRSATSTTARGLNQMGKGARETGSELAALGKSGDELQARMNTVAKAVAGVFAVSKLKGYATDMISVADAYGQMASRIGMATESQEEYERVQARLLDTANRTYRPLAEAQEMYIRTSDALRSLGYSTDAALDVTDSFTYLLTTNAASAERAQNAQEAYAKSIQSGKIEVDSWRSIMAAMPTVVDAVSQATGKSTEEIRKLGVTGKLAIGDLNEGLRQTVELNKAAAESMPTTVADALTKLANTWSVYIGEANRAGGATEKLVELINMVSENLDELVTVATRAGEVLTAVFAVKAVRAVQKFAAAQLAAAGAIGSLATAQTAQAGAAVAATRATGSLATATGLLAGAGKAAVTPLIALTGTLTTATAVIWAKVRALGALRVAMISTGVGALVVGIGVLIAKFTENKEKAEELGEAVDQAFDAPEDKVSPALRLVATEAEAARFRLTKLQQQFQDAGRDAAAVGEALKKALGTADLGSTDGITKLVADMDLLQKSAYATGEQIDVALGQRLAQLTGKELHEFGMMAEMAFNQGRISAEALARVNDQVLSASFARAGVNAAQALGGISPAAQEALDGIDALDAALQRTQANAEQTGAALVSAIDQALNKADSTAALDALVTKVKEIGAAGRLSGDQVSSALDKIRSKSDELTPGINSVTEALKRLGVTSDAELKKTAASLQEAYEAVVELGGSAREQEEAFRRYAEAAVAANDGVVESSLAVQAAQHGLSVAADESGKVIVRSMSEAAAAVRDVSAAGSEATQGLRATADAAQAAAGAIVVSARQHNDSVQGVATSWLEGADAASQYAEEAGRAAQRASAAVAKFAIGYRAVAASIDAGRKAAREFVRTMEDLDSRQAALNQGGRDGVEELRMRLLELEGTEEQVAQARAERDRATRARQIALLQIDAERARVRGDDAEASRIQGDISLLKEQINLLGQIEIAEQRRQRRVAQETSANRTSGTTSVRRVELNLGGRSFAVNTDAAGERAIDALITELERAAGVAQ